MDKLKEVQKYQFWILLAVALILPLVGWSMAVSGLAKEADEREKAIKAANDSLKTVPDDPNQDWKKGIDVINGEQGKQKLLAWHYLWERQVPLMTWPEKMPSDPSKIQMGHQEYWRTAYKKFVAQVRMKANPYDEDNPNGLMVYQEDLLPNPDSEWRNQPPSVKQIEASQEDLWLLDSMLTAIASVNAGSQTVFESPIREIEVLYFRGGTPGKSGGGAKSAGAGSGSGASSSGGAGMGMAGMKDLTEMMNKASNRGGGEMGGGMGGGGVSINSSSLNADDDLGPERAATADKAAGGSAATKTGMPTGNSGGAMADMLKGYSGGSNAAGGAGSWSGSDKDRYRDDKTEWKTRGFHLEVIMDHQHIPYLLVALSNASWPMTVLRIQVSDLHGEDLPVIGSGMPGMAGAGARSGAMSSMAGMGARSMPPGASSAPGMSGGKSSAAASRPSTLGRGSDDTSDSVNLNSRSLLEDPDLARVAIVGLIYIVKKPTAEKAPAVTPPAPGANPAAPPTGAPSAAPTVTGTGTNAAAADATAGEGDKPADEPANAESPAEEPVEKPADAKTEPAGDAAKPGPAPPPPGKP